jgi:transcriptional regulator with GAF, ATPase, and Fis domain
MNLNGLARSLGTEPDLDRLLAVVANGLVRVLGADRAFVALTTGHGFDLRASAGNPGSPSDTLIQRCIRDDRAILLTDVLADAELAGARSVVRQNVRAACAIPLKAAGETLGAIVIDHHDIGRFAEATLDALHAFAGLAALAIRNARVAATLQNVPTRGDFGVLVGTSRAIDAVRRRLARVAATPWPVHLHGESGTGKELAARAVHHNSTFVDGPFIAANCGAIPDTLAEAELLGHVRGAFTGAEKSRPGLFEQADGGTLFLDEIQAMSKAMQDILLRVVQDGVVRPVGGTLCRRVRVRLVTASNADLGSLPTFRTDLWYRLNVLRVDLPPLRDRVEDLPTLAKTLLRRIAHETGTAIRSLTAEALERLRRCPWPGNVRQLENVLRQAVALVDHDPIQAADLDEALRDPVMQDYPLMPIDEVIRRALVRYEPTLGLTRLAEMLGLSRKTLWEKKRKLGLA